MHLRDRAVVTGQLGEDLFVLGGKENEVAVIAAGEDKVFLEVEGGDAWFLFGVEGCLEREREGRRVLELLEVERVLPVLFPLLLQLHRLLGDHLPQVIPCSRGRLRLEGLLGGQLSLQGLLLLNHAGDDSAGCVVLVKGRGEFLAEGVQLVLELIVLQQDLVMGGLHGVH